MAQPAFKERYIARGSRIGDIAARLRTALRGHGRGRHEPAHPGVLKFQPSATPGRRYIIGATDNGIRMEVQTVGYPRGIILIQQSDIRSPRPPRSHSRDFA